MAYNTVYTFTAYEVLTAANLNNNDANLDYLKSKADRRIAVVPALDKGTAVAVADDVARLYIPPDLDGFDLVDSQIGLHVVSSSGLPTFQIYNLTQTADVLTTKITVDASELTSMTATTPAVIDTDEDDVAEGDILRLDCDVAGTGTKGVDWFLAFLLS